MVYFGCLLLLGTVTAVAGSDLVSPNKASPAFERRIEEIGKAMREEGIPPPETQPQLRNLDYPIEWEGNLERWHHRNR